MRRRSAPRVLLWCAAALCAAVLLAALWQLYGYWREVRQSRAVTGALAEQAVRLVPSAAPAAGEEVSAAPEEEPPITVDLEALQAANGDIVAWLYAPDTEISYPVVQGENAAQYLRRLTDGSYNINGTLFVSAANRGDFSDRNTVIYGHNMRSGAMFGSLKRYREQAYFDAHPVLWLVTGRGTFRVELFAGAEVDASDPLYTPPAAEQELAALAERLTAASVFTSPVRPEEGERLLTLSTCTNETGSAPGRFVLVGVLRECGQTAQEDG